MDVYAILAQITGLIGWGLLIYSYYKDDIDKLLYIQMISSVFYCINYYFLGAWSGLIVCIIELIKGFGYYKTDKDSLIFLLTLPVYIIISMFSFDSVLYLLPIVGSILEGYTLTKNRNLAVIGSLISNIMWVIYDILILAFTCAITDSVLVVSNVSILLLGYSMVLKTNKLRIVKNRILSRNVYNVMYNLDEKNYGKSYTWSYEYEKNVSDKSNESLMIIKYDKEVVGYLSYLVLSEIEYLNIINSKNMVKEYDLDGISNYKKNKKNYLIIDSININNKFQNYVAIDLIIKKIKKMIVSKYRDGYKVESILSIALSSFEKEILEKAGFSVYKNYSDGEVLYLLDNKTIEDLYLKNVNKRKNYHKYKVYKNDEITDEMFDELELFDKKTIQKDYQEKIDYKLHFFRKNRDNFIFVKYDNKLIGYLNYSLVTKSKYEEMLNRDKFDEIYDLDGITNFRKGVSNYLVINSVNIIKKFQDGYTIKLLTKNFKKILLKKNNEGYKIAGINATSFSKDGRKFFEYLGFSFYKEYDNNNHLYVLEDKELRKFLKNK